MKAIPSSGQDKTRDYLNHKKTLQKPNQTTEPRTPVSDPQEKTQTQRLKRTAMSSKHGKKMGDLEGERKEREREKTESNYGIKTNPSPLRSKNSTKP